MLMNPIWILSRCQFVLLVCVHLVVWFSLHVVMCGILSLQYPFIICDYFKSQLVRIMFANHQIKRRSLHCLPFKNWFYHYPSICLIVFEEQIKVMMTIAMVNEKFRCIYWIVRIMSKWSLLLLGLLRFLWHCYALAEKKNDEKKKVHCNNNI